MWLIFLLLCAPGFAQTAPTRAPAKKGAVPKKTAPAEAAPSKWPVETLTVEGNRKYTREQVLAVAGLKVGQLAGKAEFEAARDRLTASGARPLGEIKTGAHGKPVLFLHPKDFGGVLIELEQA